MCVKPLFTSDINATDPAYIKLRDGNSWQERAARKFAEDLWTKYYPCADQHYLTEIANQFHCRFWEMYLACTLIDNNYKISPHKCDSRPAEAVPRQE
jgi:hypothetical protein